MLAMAAAMGLWYQRRLAETERGVTAALAQAETFLEEGYKQTDQPERWQATALLAQSALEKAEELLEAGAGTKDLAGRLQQMRAAVDAAVADSRMLVELDHVRLEQALVPLKSGRLSSDRARTTPLYAELLGNYGINISEPSAAAGLIQGSRIREALLAALGDWQRITLDPEDRRRLEDVIHATEPPDAFAAKWRAAIGRRDRPELVELLKDPSLLHFVPTAIVDMGQDLQQMKEWAAAEGLLRAAQERHPGDFWVNHNLGCVLLHLQPYTRAEEAVGYFRVALAMRRGSPFVHHNLATALTYKRDLSAAIREYKSALQIDPNFALAHMNLGYALKDTGELEKAFQEFDAAIQEYRKALARDSRDAAAHCQLGALLWEKKDVEGAIQEVQAALKINPNYAGAHNYLGLALQKQGRLDDAIVEFRAAVNGDPQDFTPRNHLAGALFDNHQLDAAIREWQGAVHIDPKHALLHRNLAFALSVKGDLEGVVRENREAIRLEPHVTQTLVNLAWVAVDGNPQDPIIQQLRLAIRTEPDLAPVRQFFFNAWAWRLATAPDPSSRDPRRAVELAKEAIQNASKGINFFGTLGVAYYRAGDFPAAVTELEKAIEFWVNSDPRNSCNYAVFLAMAHWQLDHKEKARHWHDQAVQWIETHHLDSTTDELSRFRIEAEELLGLSGGAGSAKKNH
jgi:tetratricopeptide (TPR) repeat protein